MKILTLVASLGALMGAGGGTLAAKIYKPGPKVPRAKLALALPGPRNALRVPGVALAAGDRMQRPFDLRAGTAPITRVAFTSRAVKSSILDHDRVNGLHVRIDRCSRPWQKSKAKGRYACRGVWRVALAPRPVIGYGVLLRNLGNLPKTRTAHLLMTLWLPAKAPNVFQHRTSSLSYTFTAVQAATRR